MKFSQTHLRLRFSLIFALIFFLLSFSACKKVTEEPSHIISRVATFAGVSEDKTKHFGEPFGAAVDKDGRLYISDGEQGKIWRTFDNEKLEIVTDKLNTPSAMVFDKEGFLVVADSGSHTIKRVNTASGAITLLAGVENKAGFADGAGGQALFNAPVGVAIAEDGKIYVADTYNDKIRLIENGQVTTLAGSGRRGFADGEDGRQAKFDTPCGVAILKDGSLIVADTGNRRLRRVELNGRVTTLAGNGEPDLVDGFPSESKFVEPTAVTVDKNGAAFIADGNAIRVIGRKFFPFVETISGTKRGFTDGDLNKSRFNRPSGLAVDPQGNVFVTDAENQVVRVLSNGSVGAEIQPETVEKMKFTPEEFRRLQPARWCYNPPDKKREVAGTLGEIRGEIKDETSEVWFHNGLDIAGGYGETARFVRTEKVLKPISAENFGGLRELLRLPTMGYIHIRLGRDAAEKSFGDHRFLFNQDENGKTIGVRVPRGAKFEAGEAIGTLNSFNHVHLIAGRAGSEMNAIDALILPNNSDSVVPKIEKVTVFDENWQPLETPKANQRIKLSGKTRIVVSAYDQMDGNAARRRLGVYRLGYQLLKDDKTPVTEPKKTISFQKMPDANFVKLVYAVGSKSGYTPETVFNYIVTNEVNGDTAHENFFDAAQFEPGHYILRVFAEDFFGNAANQDLNIEIIK